MHVSVRCLQLISVNKMVLMSRTRKRSRYMARCTRLHADITVLGYARRGARENPPGL